MCSAIFGVPRIRGLHEPPSHIPRSATTMLSRCGCRGYWQKCQSPQLSNSEGARADTSDMLNSGRGPRGATAPGSRVIDNCRVCHPYDGSGTPVQETVVGTNPAGSSARHDEDRSRSGFWNAAPIARLERSVRQAVVRAGRGHLGVTPRCFVLQAHIASMTVMSSLPHRSAGSPREAGRSESLWVEGFRPVPTLEAER